MHVRTGDTVIVIAGNDKGATGAVSQVITKQNRVIVEGVNLRWKHKRATQQSPQGERVQEACAIHVSNVLLYDAETKKGTRKRKSKA